MRRTHRKDKAVVHSSNFFFLLGSLDRFFGGFKFEHDFVFRFSVTVYFYLNCPVPYTVRGTHALVERALGQNRSNKNAD